MNLGGTHFKFGGSLSLVGFFVATLLSDFLIEFIMIRKM